MNVVREKQKLEKDVFFRWEHSQNACSENYEDQSPYGSYYNGDTGSSETSVLFLM